jgi:hypothetical protein
MNTVIPNHFDRGKPFYPLVTNYVVQILGYRDLAFWGIVSRKHIPSIINTFVESLQGNENDKNNCKDSLKYLLGPLNLKSEFQKSPIDVNFDEISKELATNFDYLVPYFIRAAGGLLILAHECCKHESYHDEGPLWEFLRHCRNAVAHGGKFSFKYGEPKRPAIWGNFTLAKSMQGTLLFKNQQHVGLLSPGDPIRLLWDIEQAYPKMNV